MRAKHLIVAVEDDLVDAITLKRAFRDAEIRDTLVLTTNGEEALAFLQTDEHERPLFLLLDLNAPRMSGLEFLRIIKADECLRRIPIVVLTTSNQEQDKRQMFDLSIAGYLVKPMDYDQFVQMIKTVYAYWTINALPSE